jgi:4-amino-4-deoxy-L-arabinose transferase-like glycosyltransferase
MKAASHFAHFPSRRTFVTVLFLLAFVVRLGAVLALRNIHEFHGRSPGGADAVEYNEIALSLAAGDGYSVTPGLLTSFRPPGLPFFLSLVYRISYENYELAYLSFIALGALTCVFTYYLAREVLSESWARAAGLLSAIYFPHVYVSTLFLSEVLFTFCLALALWLLLVYFRKPSVWLMVGSGLCLGYAALTRPIGVLMPVFLLPALVRSTGWRPRALLRCALPFGLAAVAVVIPWTLRNYSVNHHLVLLTTNGGSTFYGSNNDVTLHERRFLGSWISTVYLPGRPAIDATPDEYSHDRMEWKLGEEWVEGHIVDMPLLTFYKIARFWLPDWSSPNFKFDVLELVGYTPVALLILLGLFVALRPIRKALAPAWLALHGILAANLLSTIVFYGSARFRDSIAPVLMVYAALGLQAIVGWWERRRLGTVAERAA